ncbi:hypothetical protein, partial [Gluconobacter kanchanaburiensis]|uniref:hypothetical protein n=1 Tax=Gluconobacter kanchanaburiensis TaxID=563199 RepID=UPI0035E8BE48
QSMKPSLCSKRRAKVTPETLNQSAKKLKSPDKRINQQFFDPSRWPVCAGVPCAGNVAAPLCRTVIGKP